MSDPHEGIYDIATGIVCNFELYSNVSPIAQRFHSGAGRLVTQHYKSQVESVAASYDQSSQSVEESSWVTYSDLEFLSEEARTND